MLPDHPGHSNADGYGRSNGENGVRQSRRFSGELDISDSDGIIAAPAGTHGESGMLSLLHTCPFLSCFPAFLHANRKY
jgi:hypothetical protein